jgi:hypothetical protein
MGRILAFRSRAMREWAMFQKLVKGESFRRRLRSPDIERPSHAREPERVASSTLASINRPISVNCFVSVLTVLAV